MRTYQIYLGLTTRDGEDLPETVGLTEIKNRLSLLLNSFGLDCYTLVQGVGVWKGAEEHTLIITVGDADLRWSDVQELCEKMAEEFQQDCVAAHEVPPLSLFHAQTTV